MKELVSIITPSFNSEKYIAQTIQSVQNQTYTNWELIVVDDASVDDTTTIVKKMAAIDLRITLIVIEQNSGASKARNQGIKNAKGRCV